MARKTKDIIADVGSYQGPDGTEKKRWVKCGAMFDNGSIKLDAIPVSPEWSGWLKAVEPTPFEPQQRPAPRPDYNENEPPF